MRKLKPYVIHTNAGDPLTNQVLILDSVGKILAIEPADQHDPASIEVLPGILIPGFVNAHCHLELSHLKGKVETGTGLVKFIEGVVSLRDTEQAIVDEAIRLADQEMYNNGIVAVGDICNRTDTFACKEASPLFYYSFVEMFDFWQDHLAAKFFSDYKAVYDQLKPSSGHQKSAVPHAPYSVSRTLFQLINSLNQDLSTITIHNQETPAEDDMFRLKRGEFLSLFSKFGFNYNHFQATGNASIYYALKHLDPAHRQLFVHNTLTEAADVEAVSSWSNQSYWVSCPNANLYIENRLPNYQMFLKQGAKVCLGTDSLTSNWQLCILEEIKTIIKYQSYLPQSEIIRWATIHGAEALGVGDQFGQLQVGKKPGINFISTQPTGLIHQSSIIQKIA